MVSEDSIELIARFLRDEVEIRESDVLVKIRYDDMPERAREKYRKLAQRFICLMNEIYLARFNKWVSNYEKRHNLDPGTLKTSSSEA